MAVTFGVENKIILRKGRYALVDRNHEYVVACGINEETMEWSQGYYYSHWNESEIKKAKCLNKATDHFLCLVDENHISKSRLEELATQFKDALMEDDKFSAMVFFEDFCELTENEKVYFGLDEEEE